MVHFEPWLCINSLQQDNSLETMGVNDQILRVYTVHISHLANQAVVFPADGAVEDIDHVLVHTPARTVWSGTVVAALTPRLRH